MAPRFKQLIYQSYVGNNGATAFAGFPVGQFEQIPTFRNALSDKFEKATGFKHRTDTGLYDDADVHIRFFDSKDADTVNAFTQSRGQVVSLGSFTLDITENIK